MSGFHMRTEGGNTVHVNGDPNMPEETRQALGRVMDVGTKEVTIQGFDLVAMGYALLHFADHEDLNEGDRDKANDAYSNLFHICKAQGLDIRVVLQEE